MLKRKPLLVIISSVLFLSFCWAWFVPMDIESDSESSVCKFRFQVFEYDMHDYNGDGKLSDWLFLYHYDNSHSKYGSMHFQNRIGGFWEYVGLKKVDPHKR